MSGFRIVTAILLTLSVGGCVGAALPPGTLVQPGPVAFAPPPPPVYAPGPYYAPPPPPRRCFYRDGPYGPERICPRPYY